MNHLKNDITGKMYADVSMTVDSLLHSSNDIEIVLANRLYTTLRILICRTLVLFDMDEIILTVQLVWRYVSVLQLYSINTVL